MTATIATPPKLQFFDANGVPLSGGKLYTYAAGTTTPLTSYTDESGATPNANPVILDSRGEASVWLGTAQYKMKLTTSTDVEVWTVDNLGGPDQPTLAELAASGGSALIGFIQSGGSAVARTVQAKERDVVSVMDFGAVGDGVTDDTAAVQAAINTGKTVYFPDGIYVVSSSIVNTSDCVLSGSPGAGYRDWGNVPVSRIAPNMGATIKWAGSNSSPVFNVNPDVAERISFQNLAITVPDAFASTVIKIKGCQWFNFVGVTPHVDINGVAIYRSVSAFKPGASTSIGIDFDLTDTTTPRAFFGASVSRVYAYGLNTVYRINIVNQTTPGSGNWFNSNTLGETQSYQCYRIINAIAGTTGIDTIGYNTFGPWYVQPGADASDLFAVGVIWFQNNVSQNLLHNITIYDLAASPPAANRRIQVTNPANPTNIATFNVAVNCVSFEIDSNAQAINHVNNSGRLYFPNIVFPSTPILSSDPNTLDDYEEGTFTPAVTFGGSSAGVTYTVATGLYTKIGRNVNIEFSITIDSPGSAGASAVMAITGLPFAATNTFDRGLVPFLINSSATIYGTAAVLGAASTQIDLYRFAVSGVNGLTALTKGDVTAGTTIRMNFNYSTAV